MGLRKYFQRVSADHSDFRGLVVFQEVILSVRVFRQRPSLRLETHQGFEVLCVRARNRILPCHAPPDLDGNLATRNSPTPLQRHTNA